jgi:hypothetical protein
MSSSKLALAHSVDSGFRVTTAVIAGICTSIFLSYSFALAVSFAMMIMSQRLEEEERNPMPVYVWLPATLMPRPPTV